MIYAARVMPALFTMISSDPQTDRVSFIMASISEIDPTSALTACAVPPCCFIASAVRCASSILISAQLTFRPDLAKAIAVARPIPFPAPVTRAVCM